MSCEICITVDTNDADFLTDTRAITVEEINKLRPLLKAISDFKGSYNFGRGDVYDEDIYERYSQFSEELVEEFLDMCPCHDHGFHTLESVCVYTLPEKEWLV